MSDPKSRVAFAAAWQPLTTLVVPLVRGMKLRRKHWPHVVCALCCYAF